MRLPPRPASSYFSRFFALPLMRRASRRCLLLSGSHEQSPLKICAKQELQRGGARHASADAAPLFCPRSIQRFFADHAAGAPFFRARLPI
jgi:hypothetical protein